LYNSAEVSLGYLKLPQASQASSGFLRLPQDSSGFFRIPQASSGFLKFPQDSFKKPRNKGMDL